jgi:hypothetical protein
LKELGPFFLEAGIWLGSDTIQAFFKERSGSLGDAIQCVSWNGRKIVPGSILKIEWPDGPVFVKIIHQN